MEIKKGVLTLQPKMELGDLVIIESEFDKSENGAYFVTKDMAGDYGLRKTTGDTWKDAEYCDLDSLVKRFYEHYSIDSYVHYPASQYKLTVSPKGGK